MATIFDVAKRARVSTATVSAVLNKTAYVSPPLQARVNAAIQDLGYQPNLVARSLARQRTQTLGMIALNIANPFWPAVIRGVEDAARHRRYELLLANSDDDPEKEAEHLRLFLAKRVDGILLTKARGKLPPDIVERLKTTGIPIVQLMRFGTGLRSDVVTVDEEDGSYEAVAHLVRLGYRRIGMLNGPDVSTSRRRFEGYKMALADGNLPFDPDLVVSGDFRVEDGYSTGITLLKRKPDAVFVANYISAVGFMGALRQYQLRCPEDIGIVTCDDHPWLDAFAPRLTTINLPKYELGQSAAELLIDALEPKDGEKKRRGYKTVVLRTSLLIRDSCGYPLRAGRYVRGDSAPVEPASG
ncbi:MAG: LacI family DNA-binding transcriptional regulator [Acidobacteria bacterium]|nr:LacI family DNA-binding transcriptional regulator [Acidobacteriota bacterium]